MVEDTGSTVLQFEIKNKFTQEVRVVDILDVTHLTNEEVEEISSEFEEKK